VPEYFFEKTEKHLHYFWPPARKKLREIRYLTSNGGKENDKSGV
jgi:hypothetical protein